MTNYWIFPAAIVLAMSFLIYSEDKWLCLLILLAFVVRLIILRRPIVLKLALLFGFLFVGRIMISQFLLPPKIEHIRTAQIVLFPDEIKVDGDLLSGKTVVKRQPVQFFYQIKDHKEQVFFKNAFLPIKRQAYFGEISDISPNRNPGTFDGKKFFQRSGIRQTVSIERLGNNGIYHSANFIEQIHLARLIFLHYLDQLPKWLKIHAKSLLVGYSNVDSQQLFKDLSTLGIIHLFSLSGLHVLILVVLVKKLTSILRIPHESIESVLLLLLPIYGMFVGAKIGIIRAIILSMLTIILQKLHCKVSSLDLFGMTLIFSLCIEPESLLTMGGQLSFILSLSLLYLSTNNVLINTIKLNLLSLPLITFFTYQFSILVIMMNLLFVPLFTYLILPSTIFFAIFAGKFPTLENVVNALFAWLYQFLNQIAHIKWLNWITGQSAVGIILILVVLAMFNLEHPRFFNRYLKYYLLLFFVSVMYLKFPLFGSVSLIDIGQGDSIMITTPFIRKTVLIDTGGRLGFPQAKWKKRSTPGRVISNTIPYLKYRGIDHIDEVFLSHKDVDHIGDLDQLLDHLSVNQVNFGAGLQKVPKIKTIMKHHPKVKYQQHMRGEHFMIGNVYWSVLWPQKSSKGENGDSLTLFAQIGKFKWLFTGDLDIPNEKKILAQTKFSLDYLKVGHHGSKTSTSDELLAKTSPKWGLISAGVNNRYGHPNKETIQRLDNHRVKHLNTADYGMITWYYFPIGQSEDLQTYLRVK